MTGPAEYDLTVKSVEGLTVTPAGFLLTVKFDSEPDGLLREVIQSWPAGPPGLTGMQVVRDHLVLSTDLDTDAPARALTWLLGGAEPAFAAMQAHAGGLRLAEREALAKVEQAFGTASV
ncbi:MAG TPA: hypothetical protein VFY82_10885 [Acidimicrobiales bacterium]|nr:hypothetical protein [Acidimicrobiales bacterium]